MDLNKVTFPTFLRKFYLRSNAGESPGERLLDDAGLPPPAGEGGPEMLVPHDADRGVHQVAEYGGGEAPVHPAVAGELDRDAYHAAPARAPGAAVELEPRLEGVQGVGGGLRHGGREGREGDLGQGPPAAAAGLGVVGWHLSGLVWRGSD